MNAERWKQIEDLFHQARLRQTPGERAAFLDGACGSDSALRAEVEQLLTAEDSAGSFINTSAMKVAAPIIAADRAAEMEGKTIAHYRIVSALGAGGMGEVYLATDIRNARQVALKLLPYHLAQDAERVRRFQQEARAVLALNHPNIVTVYEIGEKEGTQYIASELVKGQTLRTRMAGTSLKLHEAIDIASQVASALVEAHHEGVVHRDIKPENIMLRRDGYVKVLDFGIAKLTETQTPSTQTEAPTLMKIQTRPGIVLGSAHYMSPEQARGLSVDERTDIWSLGVVLYEMVTGRIPFDGETPSDCIAAILDKEPPALTRFVREAPEALEVIVASALTKDRDERYHSVKEFLGALRRLKQRLDASSEIERSIAPERGADVPSQSAVSKTSQAIPTTAPSIHSPSSAEYIVSEIKRHKLGVTVALAVVAVIVVAGGFAIYRILSVESTQSFRAPKFTALTNGGRIGDLAVEGELSMSPDGRYIAYVAHKFIGGAQQSSVWVMQVATNTQAQLVAPSTADYRSTDFSQDNQFVYYVRREGRSAPLNLYRVPVIGGAPTKVLDDVTSPITFAPDGKRFAFVRDEQEKGEDTKLMVANTDGSGEPAVIAERKAPEFFGENGPAWSPDGKIIACGAGSFTGDGRRTVVGVLVQGGAETRLTPQTWATVARVLWLGDGSGLIMTAKAEQSDRGEQVWQLSYPDGVARRITNDLNSYGEESLGLAADSIATIQSRMDVQVWVAAPNADESRAQQITKSIFDGVTGLAWTPDGKIVYVTATGDQIDVWRVNVDGSDKKQITSDAYVEEFPAVSPDGRYLVFTSNRNGRKLWRTDLDGRNPKQLTDGNSYDFYPAFSPDSQWVFFSSNRAGSMNLWKVGINGGQPTRLSDMFAAFPNVSPDGKWIACYHVDEENASQLIIFSVEGGQPTKTINLPSTLAPLNGHPSWSPDGKSILFVNRANNITNIWSQPIDGSPPKPITNFKSLWVYYYTPSPDGKQLALSRGDQYQDIVLIKDFR
jgi:serine/threonine protein kinase/sugar lactone lactonase YvrE